MSLVMNIGSRLAPLIGMCVLIGSAAPAGVGDQWTVTNLHAPQGAYETFAYGVCGDQQVGTTLSDVHRASLWSGSSASWVDLTPADASFSHAHGISGESPSSQQAGYSFVDGKHHAGLWNGSAESWVDLNPSEAVESMAFAVWCGAGACQQVGKVYSGSTGTHASLWTGSAASWVDLTPPFGTSYSIALGVADGQQVGWVDQGGSQLASLWSGSAASWVSLHPAEAIYVSHAFGVSGGQQVGRAFVADAVIGASFHAGLWSGSAESWVDLHPAGATWSEATGVRCVGGGDVGQQVGRAVVSGKDHASLWSGAAASWVDLHAFVPAGFDSSVATSIWSDANFIYVAGYGHNTQTGFHEALLWTHPIHALCVADVTGNETVNIDDLLAVISAWGPCPTPPTACPANIIISGGSAMQVDIDDLLGVISAWGPCP